MEKIRILTDSGSDICAPYPENLTVIPLTIHFGDEEYLDGDGKLHMEQCGLASYMHGEYFAPGKKVGSFGYSVKKRSKRTPEQQGKGRKKPAKKK